LLFGAAPNYWNVRAEGAVPLMRAATRGLNRFQVPFRMKCLTNTAFYTRNDAAVLYVDKRFYRITARVLARVYREIARHLRPDAPLFTKPLADGLALAEEPYTGESFGMQRCRILAEGLLGAHARGSRDEASRLEEVPAQTRIGFYTGHTGIGHFYLRLHDPAGVPSVLIILPEEDLDL